MTAKDHEALARGVALLPELRVARDISARDNQAYLLHKEIETIIAALEAAEAWLTLSQKNRELEREVVRLKAEIGIL